MCAALRRYAPATHSFVRHHSDPTKRPSADKLLDHPFITGEEMTTEAEERFNATSSNLTDSGSTTATALTASNELRRSDHSLLVGLDDDMLTQESIISFLRDSSVRSFEQDTTTEE